MTRIINKNNNYIQLSKSLVNGILLCNFFYKHNIIDTEDEVSNIPLADTCKICH